MFVVLYRPHCFLPHHDADRCTIEVTALMHWHLLVVLVVASSMGNEENLHLRLLPSARTQITELPDCDVFLAPSTIPGSASMRTQTK